MSRPTPDNDTEIGKADELGEKYKKPQPAADANVPGKGKPDKQEGVGTVQNQKR